MQQRPLTPMELTVYLASFAHGQPRSMPSESGRPGGWGAKYWACCAVLHLRGEGHPTDANCVDMFEEVQRLNNSERGDPDHVVVSLDWVLNQLAGMSFPRQGAAYDFIKRSAEQ